MRGSLLSLNDPDGNLGPEIRFVGRLLRSMLPAKGGGNKIAEVLTMTSRLKRISGVTRRNSSMNQPIFCQVSM